MGMVNCAYGRLLMPNPTIAAGDAQLRQLLRILDGQAAQPHRIEQLEDGGVGADAERQREDRHRGEGAALRESAHCVARIAKEAVETDGRVLGVDSLAALRWDCRSAAALRGPPLRGSCPWRGCRRCASAYARAVHLRFRVRDCRVAKCPNTAKDSHRSPHA